MSDIAAENGWNLWFKVFDITQPVAYISWTIKAFNKLATASYTTYSASRMITLDLKLILNTNDM